MCVGVVSGQPASQTLLGRKKPLYTEARTRVQQGCVVLLTCLTSTFFMTTMGDRVSGRPIRGLGAWALPVLSLQLPRRSACPRTPSASAELPGILSLICWQRKSQFTRLPTSPTGSQPDA